MIVNIEKKEKITYTYNYWFKDSKGVLVRVEGIASITDVKKHIAKTMKRLKTKYKIVNN